VLVSTTSGFGSAVFWRRLLTPVIVGARGGTPHHGWGGAGRQARARVGRVHQFEVTIAKLIEIDAAASNFGRAGQHPMST